MSIISSIKLPNDTQNRYFKDDEALMSLYDAAFSGISTTPTFDTSDNSTKVANVEFVNNTIIDTLEKMWDTQVYQESESEGYIYETTCTVIPQTYGNILDLGVAVVANDT